jgi:predicted MPP superfamily phosphohydrolase
MTEPFQEGRRERRPSARHGRSVARPRAAAWLGAGAGAFAGAAVAAAALAYRAAWAEPRSLAFPEVSLALPHWPRRLDGFRVALVSDLHAGLGHMTLARVEHVVAAVAAQRVDLVCLLGDYVDSTPLGRGRIAPRAVAAALAPLRESAVAVLGNHDWHSTGPAMGRALTGAGIRVLENDALPFAEGLWVAGLADARLQEPDVRRALAPVPDRGTVILLTHEPDLFPQVPGRVALTVAGHMHAGQVVLPVLGRRYLPSAYGTRYLHGHVVEDGRHLYVSAGIGTSGLPVRFGAPPEVPILRLSAG